MNRAAARLRPALAVVGYLLFVLASLLALGEFLGAWFVERADRHVLAEAGLQGRCRGLGGGRCGNELVEEDFKSASPAYDGFSWAEDFWRHERVRSAHWIFDYDPFLLWTSPLWSGPYVNVLRAPEGNFRATRNTECSGEKPIRIWTFGGSVTWGDGSPDFATVQSYLSEELSRRWSRCVAVENFAIEAYVSRQEVLLLHRLLRSRPAPNVVIFLDGFNDTLAGAFTDAVPGSPLYYATFVTKIEEDPWRPVRSLLGKSKTIRAVRIMARLRALDKPGTVLTVNAEHEVEFRSRSDEELRRLVVLTLDHYLENIAVAERLAQAYGFEVHWFWQPALAYGEKPLVPYEKLAWRYPVGPDPEHDRAVRAVYRQAEHRAAEGQHFVFLGHVFDSVTDDIYNDPVHVGPRGNQLMALAIADHLGCRSGQRWRREAARAARSAAACTNNSRQ